MTGRLFALHSVFVFALSGITPERLDQQARAYAALQRFNGSVLVALSGKPLLAKGYGMANCEWSVPAAPDTKFRLGSLTRQFTAMAALLLAQDGKLSVDDPVPRHWPEVPEPWRAVTIHQLLTHTSGIFNLTALPGYQVAGIVPSADVLAHGISGLPHLFFGQVRYFSDLLCAFHAADENAGRDSQGRCGPPA